MLLVTDLEDLKQRQRQFAQERDWDQFHTPKNLSMALAGEVGELLELLQWLTPQQAAAIADDPELLGAVEEEVADIQLYLWRFAEKCGVDIASAVERKLAINETKYPVEISKGSARKYTQLRVSERS